MRGFRKGTVAVLVASLIVSGCATGQGTGAEQADDSTRTTVEGMGIGALIGAGAGALLGGGDRAKSALIGAAIGGVLGGIAGNYVARQKVKYATIEQRIAGERALAEQATSTAKAQTEASVAALKLANAQFAELQKAKIERTAARSRAAAILASLSEVRKKLEANRKDLETKTANQEQFIEETKGEIGSNDPQKLEQLKRWKESIPQMRLAAANMATQIASISKMEARIEQSRGTS